MKKKHSTTQRRGVFRMKLHGQARGLLGRG